ncbi:jg3923 [Pararge aegeria aegeria]|uniref:Jg3923 protein n=1 Tax=Pararge aegeria aegeria TaxID=348720 RepID=A0A8S4RWZ6_9NEOP|nr:jg3923 [Pararge aegeria aegeria]
MRVLNLDSKISHALTVKENIVKTCVMRVKSTNLRLASRILEYFGHIARRDGDNLEKIVFTGQVERKRPRGRRPIRWSDQIRTALDTKAESNGTKSSKRFCNLGCPQLVGLADCDLIVAPLMLNSPKFTGVTTDLETKEYVPFMIPFLKGE